MYCTKFNYFEEKNTPKDSAHFPFHCTIQNSILIQYHGILNYVVEGTLPCVPFNFFEYFLFIRLKKQPVEIIFVVPSICGHKYY